MSKKLLSLALVGAMAVSLLAGCGKKDEPATSGAVSGSSSNPPAGQVYYLNFKPESDQAWQALAAQYTQETGVPVKVVTAASGTYNDVLTVEMDKTDAPTMFQCGNAGAEKPILHWMFSRQRKQRNPPSSVCCPGAPTVQQRSHLQPVAARTLTATELSPL